MRLDFVILDSPLPWTCRCTYAFSLHPLTPSMSVRILLLWRHAPPPKQVIFFSPPSSGIRKTNKRNRNEQRSLKPSLLCNFIEIALQHGRSRLNLMLIFRTPFPKNASGRLLLKRASNFKIQKLQKILGPLENEGSKLHILKF